LIRAGGTAHEDQRNDERVVVHESKRKEVPGGANQLESTGKMKLGNKNLIAPTVCE
jgi:hypothetical protein